MSSYFLRDVVAFTYAMLTFGTVFFMTYHLLHLLVLHD